MSDKQDKVKAAFDESWPRISCVLGLGISKEVAEAIFRVGFASGGIYATEEALAKLNGS